MRGEDDDADEPGAERGAAEGSDRDAILRRRNRFIAIALSGLTSTAAACYESHTPDAGATPPPRDAGRDAGMVIVSPCLGALPDDAGPKPCLEREFDAGVEEDAGIPKPCLDFAPKDGGE